MSFPQTRLTFVQRLASGGSEEDWRSFMQVIGAPVIATDAVQATDASCIRSPPPVSRSGSCLRTSVPAPWVRPMRTRVSDEMRSVCNSQSPPVLRGAGGYVSPNYSSQICPEENGGLE